MLNGLAHWAIPARAQAWSGDAPSGSLPMVPAVHDYVASVLARLIDSARQQAIADGVGPVPAGVYRAMLGYFPPALLQKARLATGKAEPLTLPALAFSYGDAIAVTLGDVVQFRSSRRAQSDLKVWAHELTHVMQYQRWGIDGFADRYVRDSSAVEQEAVDTANRFMAWHKKRGG